MTNSLGSKLREIRKSKNLILRDVALPCGMTVATVSRIEAGTLSNEDYINKLIQFYSTCL